MRAALAALALLVPGSAGAQPCSGPTCNFATLRPLVQAWGRAAMGGKSLHIVQIGDSHSAGDVLTGAWRTLIQRRLGASGRGVLPPGLPYAGYRVRGGRVTMSDGWRIAASFGPGSAAPRPPLGLSGFSLTSTVPRASMVLSLDPSLGFERFILCGIARPGAGLVTVRAGGAARVIDFAAESEAPRCEEVKQGAATGEVALSTAGGPVTLTSWATFGGTGGAALSNLGIVGSQLMHFARTDDRVLAEELRAYAPDLIVLAFGTNEGFAAPRIDENAYETALTAQIARLRTLAANTPILLLGPPDALSNRAALRGGASDCPDAPGWFAPPGLDQVRSVQRRVAAATGVAWWDWQARMGGRCSAARWVVEGRMAPDHVHFRDAGGPALAQALHSDLLTAAAGED